jgi:tricorn protease
MIAYEEMDPATNSSGGIWVSKVSGGPAVQVSRDGQTVCWSPRGDWIYFHAERNGATDVYRVRAPTQIEVGERVPFIGRVSVDRRREFGDLFDEAWTKLKDGFYDPNMHGVDWKAMKDKYRPMAVDAEIKDEFYNVVSQMLGELKASHLGIYPGGTDDEGDAVQGSAPTGYLGFDLEATTLEGGGRKITAIQTKGPADEAGLRVGDVVKSVAGTAVKADTDLDKVLMGAAGRDVALVYGKGDGSGDRTATLKAFGGGQLAALKYQLWLEKCRKTVAEKAKGEVAYIHLAGMMPPDLAKFNTALAEVNQSRKAKALVLDVRNNGGGNIHQQILQALAAKPFIAFQPRGFPKQVQPQLHWGKPIVLLINERSFSDAEVFPYGFKELKLGKVVGVPTAGGVIGTNDITLSDGSKFRVARVGWFGLNGENLEHLGVKPDVVVEETTEDRLAGRDPQLDKALELVLAEIHPPAPKPAPEAPKPAPEAPKPAPETPKPAPEAPKPVPAVPKPTIPEAPKPAPEAPTPSPQTPPPGPDASKPPVKPTDGPTDKPADKPVVKPADAPKEATGALANPLADAKKGEWVRVKVQNRGQDQTLVITVTDVTDDQVEVETASEAGGPSNRRLEAKGKEIDFGSATREGADRQENVTVNGIVLHCTVVTLKNRRGETEERWYTNEIPVRGLFKRKIGDRVVSEVLEWGSEPKKP